MPKNEEINAKKIRIMERRGVHEVEHWTRDANFPHRRKIFQENSRKIAIPEFYGNFDYFVPEPMGSPSELPEP